MFRSNQRRPITHLRKARLTPPTTRGGGRYSGRPMITLTSAEQVFTAFKASENDARAVHCSLVLPPTVSQSHATQGFTIHRFSYGLLDSGGLGGGTKSKVISRYKTKHSTCCTLYATRRVSLGFHLGFHQSSSPITHHLISKSNPQASPELVFAMRRYYLKLPGRGIRTPHSFSEAYHVIRCPLSDETLKTKNFEL